MRISAAPDPVGSIARRGRYLDPEGDGVEGQCEYSRVSDCNFAAFPTGERVDWDVEHRGQLVLAQTVGVAPVSERVSIHGS